MASRTRAQALAACRRILPPLVRILIRLGISAPEFSTVCKQVYVDTAADRLAKSAKRVSRSRIAIVTGLTRAEVTRLLKSRTHGETTRQWHLHRASRVLNAWFTDPDFVSRNGRPRDLPLKGGRKSFEALVKRYSGDIPHRAMMDELDAMSVIRRLKDGRIRVSTREIGGPRLNSKNIASLASQARKLLDTLCHNLENPSNPIFAASVAGNAVDPRVIDLLLQRIQSHGKEFLNRIDDQFRHPPGRYKARSRARSEKLGVTVFAHREFPTERRRARS